MNIVAVLGHQSRYNIVAVLGHQRRYNIGLLRSIKFYFFSINQILDFVLKRPAIIGIVRSTVGMVGTLGIGVVVWRGGVRVLWRFLQTGKIQLQQVREHLSWRHVDVGELPLWPFHPLLIRSQLIVTRLII